MIDIQFKSFFAAPEEALMEYHDRGFHIEENLISSDICDQVIEASLQLENAMNRTYRPSMMPHKTHSLFFELMKNTKVVHIISKIVGGKVSGIQSELFYCKPGTPGFAPHQDNFFVQAPPNNFASAWIALVDVIPKSGGLIVYPESHKEGDLPVQDFDKEEYASQDPNARKMGTIIPEKYKPIHPSLKKGSVLFIHGHVVHASNKNESHYNRYVLLNTYIKQGVSFRPGQYAAREEIALE